MTDPESDRPTPPGTNGPDSTTRAVLSGLGAAARRLLVALVGIWRSVRTAGGRAGRYLHRAGGAGTRTGRAWLAAASGERGRGVVSTAETWLVGARRDLAATTLVLAPLLALASAWAVGSAGGFGPLYDSTRGTWYGTDPHLTLLYAAAGVALLAAGHAAANSGLLPSVLLAAAPVFGAGLTSYGTAFGAHEPVSLPDALVIGAASALVVGLPLGVLGFGCGVGLRRVVRLVRGHERSEPGDGTDAT